MFTKMKHSWENCHSIIFFYSDDNDDLVNTFPSVLGVCTILIVLIMFVGFESVRTMDEIYISTRNKEEQTSKEVEKNLPIEKNPSKVEHNDSKLLEIQDKHYKELQNLLTKQQKEIEDYKKEQNK